jgi:asparagine synthase (glutamine-hydrolysing)
VFEPSRRLQYLTVRQWWGRPAEKQSASATRSNLSLAMPGIVGLITKMPRERAVPQLKRMVETLCHERFYTIGTRVEESLGVYVGWVARKDSFSDGMPLRNERGDVVLVFSGEEFPEPGTAHGLKVRGHELDLAGPSYLVHLYEEDPSFPAGLNGNFHGLLTDQSRGTATLFNDRYGMHRIYYHESKDALYFAAEAKAILAVCPETRRMEPLGLAEFVSCGSVLENRTLFEGVRLLPPASAWVFRSGVLDRKSSYFHPREWEDQETLNLEGYYRELREVFTRNLPRYFNGRQGIGMSLTGGLDTRMIMAWWKPRPGSLPCYTFGGMLRDCQDVTVARQVARACDQPHEVIRVGEDFLSLFSHYAERAVYLADGCVGVDRAPDLYLNEKAREIAPIRMTGNYGGEVLRRVRAFKAEEPIPGLFRPELFSYVRQTRETYASLLLEHPVSFAAFKQAPWHHYGILALEQTQLSMRSPYLDNDFVRILFRAPESALATHDLSLRLIADGNPALLRIPTDRGLGGAHWRFSEAAHRGLLEFLFKAEYAYDMGMPQWVAGVDHLLSPLRLERLFLGRHKIFHFRTWYRDALAGYVRHTLLDPHSCTRSYIDRNTLESMVLGHLKGARNYTNEIHKVLTLELLHRLFLDNPQTNAPTGHVGVPLALNGT